MSERESWSELRDRRMKSPAARAGYEQARAAYEVGRMVRELRGEGPEPAPAGRADGTTQSVVGRLEAGGSRPTIVTLERVAHALGLRLEVRFQGMENTPKPRARRQVRKVVFAGAEQ